MRTVIKRQINTEETIRKLSRAEMLEMMILQAQEIERQQNEINELSKKLNSRELLIDNAGTMSEASALVNNVFLEADRAAKEYLVNIDRMNMEVDKLTNRKLQEAQENAYGLVMNAKRQAGQIIEDAHYKADQLLVESMRQSEQAKKEADAYWDSMAVKMDSFIQEYQRMREIVNSFGGAFEK